MNPQKTSHSLLLLLFSILIIPESLTGQKVIKHLSDTVINTGFDTVRVKSFTGPVAVTDGSELASIPGDNITNLLQGRIPGLEVIGNGMPGSSSMLRIRGYSSFFTNTPLFVVDGTIKTDVSYLNPSDIDHISVLKDAAYSSLYGARSGGGVIAIATKKGRQGLHVAYDMSTGVQLPGKGTKDDLLNSREYADLQWLVYKNDGVTEFNPLYGPSSNPAPQLPGWAANTDWYKAITRPALLTNHNLSLSAGTKNAKIYAGLGYFGQDGVIKYTYSRKYSARLNSEISLLKNRITIGENLSFVYRKGVSVPNLSSDSPVSTGPYRSQPIIPVIITQPITGLMHNFVPGEWGGTGIAPRLGPGLNTLAELTRAKNNIQDQQDLSGNVYLNIKILEGLNIHTSYGGSLTDLSGKNYYYATYEARDNRMGSTFIRSGTENKEKVWTTLISFGRKLGKHSVKALAGYEASRQFGGYNWNAQKVLTTNQLLDSNYYRTSGIPERAVFATAGYGYDNRYLLNLVFRQDWLSQFGSSIYQAYYPSISAAWVVSNENFMKNSRWLSFLKIRGSYGITGRGVLNLFSTDLIVPPGFVPEKVYNYDIGTDIEFLESKLRITADWYARHGFNLDFIATMPSGAGPFSSVLESTARMKNRGLDVQLVYTEKWREVGFTGKFIISANKSTITEIFPGIDYFDSGIGDSYIGTPVRNQAGHSPSAFYGYKVMGLFQTTGEVAAAPPQDGAAPGFFRFQDSNKDGFITPDDRIFIGDPAPSFTCSLSSGVSWKSFDISAFFYCSEGNDIFNMKRWYTDFWPSFQGEKSKRLLYDSWTPERTSTTVPKASNTSNFSTNTQITSYYIEDGSYLRLRSLELGYTFPESITRKIHLDNLRLYLQAVNLFTLTKYSGLDPELGGNDYSFGVDSGNYPHVKQLLFGLSVNL